MPGDRRGAGVHVRAVHPARAQRLAADAGGGAVRAGGGLRDRRSLRLHGGAHRRVEQSDLGRRDPLDRGVRLADDARRARHRRDPACAGRLRALRHRDRLRLCHDLQRQPAGPEDGPARGRLADAPADRADRRRRSRGRGHPLGAQSPRQGVRIRRRTEHRRRGGQPAARPTGHAHLRAGAGGRRWPARLADDRHRRSHRGGVDPARCRPRRAEAAAYSAPRRGDRDLPADVGDLRRDRGRGDLALVPGPREGDPQPRSHRTAGDAGRVGPDRRGEPLGRDQRRAHRGDVERRPDRPGPGIVPRRPLARRGGLRGRDRVAVPVDAAARRGGAGSPTVTDVAERLSSALADRYRIERELGAGGMATVYLAQDLRHDRKVAIKVLRPELAAVIGAERFLSEIKTTANLQHPHILPLHDSGRTGGKADGRSDDFLYYVMPYVEGETLRDKLNRETQLGIHEAVRIATEVASALDYAHRHGVIHRDIKPENILLHDGRALVADFGIALAASKAGGTRMTETGMSLGTPAYMSPEQAMGQRDITAQADIYALGCVLYEMLVGELPFEGANAQAIIARVMTEEPRSLVLQRRSVPHHVEAAVMTALSKLPADRFGSAAQFAAALGDPGFAAGRLDRGPASTVPHTGRNRLLSGVPWALLAVAAGLLVWALRPRPPNLAPVLRLDLGLPPT